MDNVNEAKDLEKENNGKLITESSPWDKRSRIGEWTDAAQAIYSEDVEPGGEHGKIRRSRFAQTKFPSLLFK